jgi:hypothetical protein
VLSLGLVTEDGRNAVATYYLGGLAEEEEVNNALTGGTYTITRSYYTLNGAVVAQREHNQNTGSNTLTYTHGDHLGSVSLTTNLAGQSAGVQRVCRSSTLGAKSGREAR